MTLYHLLARVLMPCHGVRPSIQLSFKYLLKNHYANFNQT